MAGLLDSGYWGDNTAKDPTTGLTQADRRDPLWAGLIQGGMGLLAASQDLTPQARAQMMAQAGGAYAGIPAAMMAQKTAGAQQVLQQQQIKAGQSKLDAQARLAAMAKTPEFQEAVAKLEPDQRLLLQAALDAGDMAHATTILSSASAERRTLAETARKEARDDRKEAAKAAADAAKEAGFGNTPYGINARNLRDAPTDSYAYWLAYQFFSTEQKNPDGSIIAKLPNMAPATWKPGMPPGGTPKGAAAPAPAPAPTPEVPAPVPAPTPAPTPPVISSTAPVTADVAAEVGKALNPGDKREVNGVEISKDKAGNIVWNDGTDYYKLTPKGSTPERKSLIPPPEHDKAALTTFHNGLNSIDLLENELKTNKNITLGPGARLVTAVLGNDALALSNPEGQRARQLIASLTSEKIKAQSGANVTEAEFARLDKYLPKEGDKLETIQTKLIDLRREMQSVGRDRYVTLPPETRMNPEWRQRFGGGTAAAPAAADEKKWKIGDKWTDPAGRKWVVGPDGQWKED